ncbi:carboxypeptidase-like regulatory domain-containing protein [Dokdonia sp. R86516]|uniref:carboxypeptidase-like regulatory domain-containing protein n=1 Tax=Dokdonia sp. R86516 TaxID=3093856 RepID=UPI0037CBCFF8
MIKKIRYYILLTVLISSLTCYSQIQGTIIDAGGKPIQSATVILKKTIDSSFVSYTRSDAEGFYSLKPKKTGNFLLSFSSLGHAKKTYPIVLSEVKEDIKLDIVLKDEIVSLDEVVVSAELDITQKKDTISFNAKAFAQGNEEVVEDLLKKIPGLNIDTDGTIKIGDREVEKVMVDGDDFFERGYKLLTKNMPAQPIDKIELLQNYSNNHLLKDVEESERVALNLKLNDDAKRIWFGNVTLGYDPSASKDRYDVKGNLMNFGKKNKYYFLTILNNIGFDATGDINHLIRPLRFDQPASLGDDQSLNSLINLSARPKNFNKNRTTFNNAEMASLNAIFNPTEKLKIKALGFFNWDELDFFRNKIEKINVANENFTNTEDYTLKDSQRIGFVKGEITYNLSKNQQLESIVKYENANFNTRSDLIFNNSTSSEQLEKPLELIDQKTTYTNRFKNNKALLITGRFIKEKTPQTYQVNQFLFEELFPNTTANNVEQTLDQEMMFLGIEAHILDRKKSKNLFEFKAGNTFRKDKLNSNFSLLEDRTSLNRPEGYQNNSSYSVNDLYVKGKYHYKLNNITFIGNLGLHQLFNRQVEYDQIETQQQLFINPSAGIDYKIDKNNRVKISYAQNRTNATVLDIYSNFVLTGFRNFNRGTGEFNQLDASAFLLDYRLGNWSDRFFATTSFTYTKNHDFFSTNTLLTQNFSQTNKIVIKDREALNANASLDFFIKKLSSNIKVNLGYSKSEFTNFVNNSQLRQVLSANYQYGFELRSAFDSFFDFNIGGKWLVNNIETVVKNEFTDNVSFIDLNFYLSKELDMDLQGERYHFGNLQTDNTYYFLDLNARYTIKKNKIVLMLSGKNLLNTKTFRNTSISDIGSSTTEYRILPRYALLKLSYRF